LTVFDPDHVAAIFGSAKEAESAVEDLRALGIADEHLGLAVHEPGVHIALEEDEETDMQHAVARGGVAGAVIGAIAGISIMAVASTGVGAIGVGGMLVGGLASLFGGAAIGAELTVAAEQRVLGEVDHWASTTLEPGQVLIVAKAHDQRAVIESTMQRHHGRILTPSA
jgi:hypothetical protein